MWYDLIHRQPQKLLCTWSHVRDISRPGSTFVVAAPTHHTAPRCWRCWWWCRDWGSCQSPLIQGLVKSNSEDFEHQTSTECWDKIKSWMSFCTPAIFWWFYRGLISVSHNMRISTSSPGTSLLERLPLDQVSDYQGTDEASLNWHGKTWKNHQIVDLVDIVDRLHRFCFTGPVSVSRPSVGLSWRCVSSWPCGKGWQECRLAEQLEDINPIPIFIGVWLRYSIFIN